MSLQRGRKYVLFSLVIFGFWILSSLLLHEISLWVKEQIIVDNKVRIISFILVQSLFIAIGALLGLEQFINFIKQQGKWRINKEKLLFIGLPAIYFTFYFLIHFYVQFISLRGSIVLFILEDPFKQIAGVILGYVIITSIYKEKDVGMVE